MTKLICALLLVSACSRSDKVDSQPASDSSTARASVDTAPSLPVGVLPPIGLAVAESAGVWCAEFISTAVPDSTQASHAATLVFGRPGGVVSIRARVGARRDRECSTAFPQPRWADYLAFNLQLVDSFPASSDPAPIVGLIVLGETPWSIGPDGHARADLDRDSAPEELRRCAADEGEHFTIWTLDGTGGRTRRWHEYFDWGAIVDPTCGPGENGQ